MDSDLLEKLRKIERLYAGATTAGEKEAAADAMARITKRLKETAQKEAPQDYKFTLTDDWSKKLFVALLHRYSLKPYRLPRQRRHTVRVRVPRSFVEETLWPEFLELSDVLKQYLDDITDEVIRQGIHEDAAEEERQSEEYLEE